MQTIFLLLFLFTTVIWLMLFVVAVRFIYLWIHAYYGNDQQQGSYGRFDRGCPEQLSAYDRIILSVSCENAALTRAVQRRRDCRRNSHGAMGADCVHRPIFFVRASASARARAASSEYRT